jgi:uncharacterized protein (TIGR03437 family)
MLTRAALLSLLLLTGAAAQQPSSIIRGDPFDCFTMHGAAASNLTVVGVDGMPFAKAWRIRTPYPSPNPWDIRIRCFDTLPVKSGDTILATFWMRALSSRTGLGLTTFVVEKGRDPWTKSAEWTTGAGAEWKKVEVPFTMLETYTSTGSEGYNISFWVTFEPQEIEIGGLSVMNYGQNYPLRELGLSTYPYDGHRPDAPWRAQALDRIEKIRKADIVVVVRDDDGKPVAHAPVRVRMTRHAFGFGSAVDGHMLMDNSLDGAKYQEMIPQLFNKAVLENDLKWPFWESWSRESAAFALGWLPAHGITDIRGHNIIWPDRGNLPPDVVSLFSNPEALRQRIYDHIREVMTFTKGKVTEWDVLNEPYTSKDVQAILGDREMAVWFQKAREADPNVKLYVNDFNIVEAGGWDVRHQNHYYDTIRFILDNGGPIDGIGLQCHFNANLTAPARALEVLDRFAEFGKDLEVTEFDINIADEEAQAQYTRDFLTLAFSHPAVKGFMLWGFWEGKHWLPRGAIYRRDWSIRPNGEAWRDLIFNQWWTDAQGTTGADGVFRTRGFLGEYVVEATAGGETREQSLTVTGGQSNYVRFGKHAAGTIPDGAVVNAASFARGPVAPGEIVTIFGSGFGPAALALAAYGASGQLPQETGDTRVYFDAVTAPMIYSLTGQVSAIVPYAVSSQASVAIEYQGVRTNAVSVPVAAAAPGIFTVDSSGKGQAVVVNYRDDGSTSLNSAAEPAEKGKFVSFFLTGEGQMNPAGVDGKLPVYPNNPVPVLPVAAFFGGIESRHPDQWCGLIYAGVLQCNVRVPLEAPTGAAVPVVVTVGGVPSQGGVVVSIR